MDICLNCFKNKGEFEVCPHCGFVEGTPPEQAYHLSPGIMLANRYLLGTVIDFGGFGVIYRAWDTHLSKVMAIKEFFPAGLVTRSANGTAVTVFEKAHLSGEYGNALSRFLAEARTIAVFHDSPYIVNVFNYFEANYTAYFVMEYLDGISLSDYLAHVPNGRLDPDEAFEFIRPVIDGLASIHAAGIVHRDIHPGNIFITTENHIKIIDFGAARLSTGDEEATLTVIATQGYTAPEQYRNKSKQGPFTDVYGLSATLYKMLTGVLPDESPDRQVNDTLVSPLDMGVLISKNANNAIMRALAVNPELRFQKVLDFKAALLEGKKADDPKTVLRKRMTRRGFIIGGSVLLVGAASGIGWLLWDNYEKNKTLENTKVENDSISIWLPATGDATEQQAQLDLWRGLCDEFIAETKENENNGKPTITIDIQAKPVAEYAAALNDAAANETLPTIFVTDHSDAGILDHAAPLDILLKTLQKEEYLFLDRYESIFPTPNRVPLGFDMLTAYGNEIKAAEVLKKQAAGSEQTQEGDEEQASTGATVEIDPEAAEAAGEQILAPALPTLELLFVHEQPITVYKDAYSLFLALYHPELAGEGGVEVTDQESLAKDLRRAELRDQQTAEKTSRQIMAENKPLYLIDFVSAQPEIASAIAGKYRIIQMTNESTFAGMFRQCCGVSTTASENQQNAAMLFLIYMMRNYAQNTLHVQNKNAMPINLKAFTDFWVSKPDLAFLADLDSKQESVSFPTLDRPELKRFTDDFYNEIVLPKVEYEDVTKFVASFTQAETPE